MGRRKTVKRKVLGYKISNKRTRRGNPEYYYFYLDCGHVRCEHHCPEASITAFMVEMRCKGKFSGDVKIGCFDCAEGKGTDFEGDWLILRHMPYYAYKYWKEINPKMCEKFDDFCESKVSRK